MNNPEERLALAAKVREACIEAALEGYENAAIAGLCGEGALEVAISAMRQVDLDEIAADGTTDG
ncbi:acetyltransferase [Salinisphaera dokdonensis CL-ES53]|uniref:Acetyltransferase n=1 Tax=Salinisphaera dokdonensis CL-ES53 TaxID=1304272 RepID=A0ABV2AZM2_9GAMM